MTFLWLYRTNECNVSNYNQVQHKNSICMALYYKYMSWKASFCKTSTFNVVYSTDHNVLYDPRMLLFVLSLQIHVPPLENHCRAIINPSNIVTIVMFITMVIAEWHNSLCFYCTPPHPLIFFRSLAAVCLCFFFSPCVFQGFRGPVNHGFQFPCSGVFTQE